jgi:hypothetical protein
MVIKLDPKTEFFTKLEKLYKVDKTRDAVFNALFFIYHPLSSSYERPYEEKKVNAQRNILFPVGVKLEDLDKTSLVSLFVSDCMTKEERHYATTGHLLDTLVQKVSANLRSSKKLTAAESKEFRAFITEYEKYKEALSVSRKDAALISNISMYGGEIPSFRDRQEIENLR